MSKHTPGPWHYEAGYDGGDSDDSVAFICHEGTSSEDTVVAAMHLSDRVGNEASLIADARLIAAAPDLLAALERLASYGNIFRYKESEVNPYEQAMAAIAKAKGE